VPVEALPLRRRIVKPFGESGQIDEMVIRHEEVELPLSSAGSRGDESMPVPE
jgi:hypothetical protein